MELGGHITVDRYGFSVSFGVDIRPKPSDPPAEMVETSSDTTRVIGFAPATPWAPDEEADDE